MTAHTRNLLSSSLSFPRLKLVGLRSCMRISRLQRVGSQAAGLQDTLGEWCWNLCLLHITLCLSHQIFCSPQCSPEIDSRVQKPPSPRNDWTAAKEDPNPAPLERHVISCPLLASCSFQTSPKTSTAPLVTK